MGIQAGYVIAYLHRQVGQSAHCRAHHRGALSFRHSSRRKWLLGRTALATGTVPMISACLRQCHTSTSRFLWPNVCLARRMPTLLAALLRTPKKFSRSSCSLEGTVDRRGFLGCPYHRAKRGVQVDWPCQLQDRLAMNLVDRYLQKVSTGCPWGTCWVQRPSPRPPGTVSRHLLRWTSWLN